jgi:PEGA domain
LPFDIRKFASLVTASALICITSLSGAQETKSGTQQVAQTDGKQQTPSSSGSSSGAPQVSQAPKPNTLLDGTPVKLRLGRTLSSAEVKTGDQVDFEVLEDVLVDKTVVIPKGGVALATVTDAEHKKSMGRAGKLNVNIDSVRLVDGEKAALRATEGGKGGGHVGAMTGAMVATSIVFFPAAPLFLFIHGKDIVIPKGTEITAYVNGDMTLEMAKFQPAVSTAVVASASESRISVDANVPNCDIEVDGAFAGNTPSELSLAPGKHQIAVTKKGYVSWSRTMMVSGSAIHLNAELEAEAPAAAAPAATNK